MNFFRKRLFWIIVIALAAIAALVWWLQRPAANQTVYQTAPAERGLLVSSVGATGVVRAGQTTVLTWQTSGRIETVNASLGATVKADEVLASLAENSLPQNVVLAQANLVTAQQDLENLTSSNLALAQAMQNLANAKQTVEDAQADYDRLSRVRVSDELIKDTQDQIDQLKRQLKFQQWIFDRFFAHLYDGNPRKAEFIVNLTTTKDRINTLLTKQNWYTSRPTEIQVEKALAALNLAKAQQADAQREVDRYSNGRSAQDIAAAQAKVDAAQATLNLSKAIAPFDGVITEAGSLPGDVVLRGTQAFRLEDLTRLVIDLQVSEIDINNLMIGQSVSVVFDAVPEKTYNGSVTKINLAGETVNGAVVFPVTVELSDADELVKPGMTAAVTVTVKEVQDALLVPNRAVRIIAGERVVYVLKADQPVAVKIRLGAMADSFSEVVGGDLQPGDLIILNPPTNIVTNSGS